MIKIFYLRNSGVAQLTEQVAVKHPVGGSNPSPGANFLSEDLILPDHVYILQSKTTAQFYVGHTDIERYNRTVIH